ncbi:MAG: O-antigen ligase family protein [Taibaiella sp.]|jgi:hypothetical protein
MRKKLSPLFLIVAVIYMFFNSFLLPEGLLFTTLLTPFFFLNMVKENGLKPYFIFLLITVLFAILQLPTVDYVKAYVKSFILLQCVAIFTINTYLVLKERDNLAGIFKILGTVNLVLLLLSIIALFIPLLRPYLWFEMSMSEGLPIISRLKMLTYEASYYSLIIIPVFSYYFLKRILLNSKTGVLLISLVVSLLLSLSFGVLAGILIGLILIYCFNLNELGRRINLNYLATGLLIIIASLICLYIFKPDNVLFERIRNIISGKDTSANGRTYESFILAWNIAKTKSTFWGMGLGQLKLIGRDYIIQYYLYTDIHPVIRIPNAVAETLNIYGIAGLVFRFAVIIYFFIKTKVWNNYYRLLLFIFIFIYQFTGSFIFNIAEYVIWVLAFSPGLFSIFDKRNFLNDKR